MHIVLLFKIFSFKTLYLLESVDEILRIISGWVIESKSRSSHPKIIPNVYKDVSRRSKAAGGLFGAMVLSQFSN